MFWTLLTKKERAVKRLSLLAAPSTSQTGEDGVCPHLMSLRRIRPTIVLSELVSLRGANADGLGF